MKSDPDIGLIVCVVCTAIVFGLGGLIVGGRAYDIYWKQEIIRHGCASYEVNSTNGEVTLKWKDDK